MKVLLTHGYYLYEDPKEQVIMRPYVPLGILAVAAWLDRKGIQNEVFDTTFAIPEELPNYLLEHQPAYLAIYVNLMTRVNVINLIRFVKQEENLANTKIILGGPDVKYNAEDLLRQGGDYLVIGEGEKTMEELVLALDSGADVSGVDGLGYLKQGQLHFTQEREKLKELDGLPIPAREKIDMHQYLDTWKKHHQMSTISLSTMRGCPYTCKWCSRAVYGLSYRRRSPELVVEEMRMLQERYAPDAIWIVDDVFTVSHKWLRAFADEVKKKGLKMPYECITRADRMNEEVIALLKETGCFRVWIGAESGSQKVIDLMDRRVEVGHVRDMIIQAQQNGIQAGTFIMLGYPGETEADINETVHHLKTSNPDYFTITVAYPIKGTEFFQEIEGVQTNTIDFLTQSDRDRDFKRTYTRRYYDYAVRYVVNEVNYHKLLLQKKHLSKKGIGYAMRSRFARFGMWYQRTKSSKELQAAKA